MSEAIIPLAEPDLRGNEEVYLRECIRTGWVSSAGPYVNEMERRLAELAQCEHAVATMNGTVAIQLLLAAIGIKPGQRVIVPNWTFAATVNATIHAGATPVLVDIHPEHWCLDAELVDAELQSARNNGTPIGAVVAVDPLGLPADIDPLIEVCTRHGVPLLEDAAGAIGSTYKGRPVGALTDAGILSFNGNKIVTGGGGGAILTNNAAWAAQARHLSTQARRGPGYEHDAVGFNFRMTNLNAAVVVAQLERLDDMIAARRVAAAAYDAVLRGRDDLAAVTVPNWAGWNAWMYVVRAATPAEADRLLAHLEQNAIGARPFWIGLSGQPVYAAYPRRLNGVSERLSGCLVSIPSGSSLTQDQIGRIVEALGRWRGAALNS